MAAPTAPISGTNHAQNRAQYHAQNRAPLDALGDALRRDLDAPDPRSAGFSTRDAYARVAPAENRHENRTESQRGPTRRWNVGYSPGIGTIGIGAAIELLMQCLAYVADQGGGEVTLWRQGAIPDDDRAARSAGLDADRELLQMRVALPRPAPDDLEVSDDIAVPVSNQLPDAIRLRNFEPGRDDTAWLALNNAAFAGHAEQGDWDAPILRARLREPWFDASWFLLAERDAELVGFNWLRRHPATRSDPEMGEIYVIGVAPTAQGQGLGRALTVAGTERIAAAGLTTAVLYVAGDNTTAIALYRALGFEVTRTDRAYTALVVPADS